MSVLCGSFSACAKNAFSSSFFAHFCTQNTNSVCLSARFLHKSEEMGFLLLMAFLLKNLHFLGRKSAFSTFCPQFCGKPNAKKTRAKSVKIFTKHTFYRYVWRGQNHCLAREKVRPREGKIPTTWHRKNLEFANFDIFIPEMNSIFSCPALVQSQISASCRDLCCPSPLTDPETSSGWRWWSIVGLWSS